MQTRNNQPLSQMDIAFGVDERARRQRLRTANAIPSETDVSPDFSPARPGGGANLGGEPDAVAANDTARDSFESNSGEVPAKTTFENPYLHQMENTQSQITGIQNKANVDALAPVSGKRKALGVLGGIGVGLATGNPLAGFGVYEAVTQHPAQVVRQRAAEQTAPLAQQMATSETLAGLQNTFGQRQAEVQTSENSRADVARQANKQSYDVAHPKMQPVNTETGQQSPEQYGALPGGANAIQAQAPAGPKSGDYEIKVDGQSRHLITVNKLTGETKDTGVEAPDDRNIDQFLAVIQTEVPGANQIMEKMHNGVPLTPEETQRMQAAEEKFFSETRPNYGLDTGAANRGAAADIEANVAEISSLIEAHLNDIKVNRNDPNAYKTAVAQAISEYSQAKPEDQQFMGEVQKRMLTVTPTRPPAAKSGGGLGAIVPK